VEPHGGQPIERVGAPLGEGCGVVILVHGRGAGPRNILDLVPMLDRPDFSYLAPAAAGGTWYPYSFMAPIARNEPGISSGIAVLHGLIDQVVSRGVPTDRIVLLGFSQGACLAVTAAQRRPSRYGGVVVYSGALIGPPGSVWDEQGTFGGAPVFFGCSDMDAHVPRARVEESAAVLARMGATVTARIYPGMGHLVNDDELAFAQTLLAQVAARAPTPRS
jgi:predicted esterase